MPGTASFAGGAAFLAEAAKPSTCHDGALCGLDAMGNGIEGIFGLGLLVVGGIVLAVAGAVRRTTWSAARRNSRCRSRAQSADSDGARVDT